MRKIVVGLILVILAIGITNNSIGFGAGNVSFEPVPQLVGFEGIPVGPWGTEAIEKAQQRYELSYEAEHLNYKAEKNDL